MRRHTLSALFGLILLCTVGTARAQKTAAPIPYIAAVPLEYPRVGAATDATREVALFGDPDSPGFVDMDPADGIDDERGELLRELAVRFAPFLVMNTSSVPMEFDRFVEEEQVSPLHVETWEMSEVEPRLVNRQSLEWRNLGKGSCADGNADDCLFFDLLERFNPVNPSDTHLGSLVRVPGASEFSVLFFDFPGSNEEEWKQEFTDRDGALPERYRDYAHVYAHPFVKSVEAGGGPAYELIIQYWLFYPTNDGGNNHEGDWEHVNVVVAPKDRVRDALTLDDIRALISEPPGDVPSGREPVIRRLEYYFHHHLIILDYATPNVYQPREAWEAEMKAMGESRIGIRNWWRSIRDRAYLDRDETVVNTHPVGFIGADNKGFDQVMALPGDKNRDSHGTYPFPGLFKNIGPAGATEAIVHSIDLKAWAEPLVERGERPLEPFTPGSVIAFDRPDRITVLPDYEWVLRAVQDRPSVRRSLGWMLLPIYWGQPRAVSPFSGLVAHADLGNIAPPGPAHNSGWNRSGESSGYEEYLAHRFVSLFPLGFQDNYSNRLGFLNLTVPTLVALPPFDFVYRLVSSPIRAATGRFHPTYYPGDPAPPRLIGVQVGLSRHHLPGEMSDLLYDEDQFVSVVGALLAHMLVFGSESTTVTGVSQHMDRAVTPDFTLFFNLSNRFVTENTVRNVRADFEERTQFSDAEDFVLAGTVNLWEYVGGFRYNLAEGSFQPFIKLGYGLSWYRIEDLKTDGLPIEKPESRWIRRPEPLKLRNVFPNTVHFGTGFELIPIRNARVLPGGLGLGLRAQALFYRHNLGLDEDRLDLEALVALGFTAPDLPRDRVIWRNEYSVSLTIAF